MPVTSLSRPGSAQLSFTLNLGHEVAPRTQYQRPRRPASASAKAACHGSNHRSKTPGKQQLGNTKPHHESRTKPVTKLTGSSISLKKKQWRFNTLPRQVVVESFLSPEFVSPRFKAQQQTKTDRRISPLFHNRHLARTTLKEEQDNDCPDDVDTLLQTGEDMEALVRMDQQRVTTNAVAEVLPRGSRYEAHSNKTIVRWLESFEKEESGFKSTSILCEMKMYQAQALMKSTPNKLQAAVALGCLHRLASIFGRYQSILGKVLHELGACIFENWTPELMERCKAESSTSSETSLYFVHGRAFFDQETYHVKQISDLHNDLQELHQVHRKLQLKYQQSQSDQEELQSKIMTMNESMRVIKEKKDKENEGMVGAYARQMALDSTDVMEFFKACNDEESRTFLCDVIDEDVLLQAPQVLVQMINTLDCTQREECLMELIQSLSITETNLIINQTIPDQIMNRGISRHHYANRFFKVQERTGDWYHNPLHQHFDFLQAAKEILFRFSRKLSSQEPIETTLSDEEALVLARMTELVEIIQSYCNHPSIMRELQENIPTDSSLYRACLSQEDAKQRLISFLFEREATPELNLPPPIVKVTTTPKPTFSSADICQVMATIVQDQLLQLVQASSPPEARIPLHQAIQHMFLLEHGQKSLALAHFYAFEKDILALAPAHKRIQMYSWFIALESNNDTSRYTRWKEEAFEVFVSILHHVIKENASPSMEYLSTEEFIYHGFNNYIGSGDQDKRHSCSLSSTTGLAIAQQVFIDSVTINQDLSHFGQNYIEALKKSLNRSSKLSGASMNISLDEYLVEIMTIWFDEKHQVFQTLLQMIDFSFKNTTTNALKKEGSLTAAKGVSFSHFQDFFQQYNYSLADLSKPQLMNMYLGCIDSFNNDRLNSKTLADWILKRMFQFTSTAR